MNRFGPLILLAAAALLFAFIALFDRDNPAAPPGGSPLLPGLDPEKIEAIEVVRSNLALRVERTNQDWRLMPGGYPAWTAAIRALLGAAAGLNTDIEIGPKEYNDQPGGLASYGLAPAQATLIFFHRAQRVMLQVGRQSPVGGKAYVQLNGAPAVRLIDAKFLDLIPLSANHWRDPRLINLRGLAFNRVEVRPLSQFFALQRDPGQPWRMVRPMESRTDTNRVDFLLRRLQEWPVSGVFEEGKLGDLEGLGLQPPEMELVFAQGPREVLAIQFGKSPTNDPSHVFARRSNPTNIVLVTTNVLNDLRLPYTELRDRRLVTVDESAVDLIEIKAEERFVLRRANSNSWQISEPAILPADPGLIADFFLNLNSLQILEFKKEVVTDFSEFGLTPPARQYILKANQTNSAGALAAQTIAGIEFGANDVDKVFVRRGDENAVYAVSLGESLRLPRAAFELRQRQLWNFESSNVVSLVVTQNGRRRQLIRNPSFEWSFAPGSQGMVNTFSLEETLHQLGKLAVVSWVAKGDSAAEQFGIPQTAHGVALEIKRGGQSETLTLDFGRQSAARNIYAATVLDSQRIVFEFPALLYHKYVLADLTIPVSAAGP